jgi:Cytochrome P450
MFGLFVDCDPRWMLNDPRVFSDPSEFRPERFLGAENQDVAANPSELAFGFGRRSGDFPVNVDPQFIRRARAESVPDNTLQSPSCSSVLR